MKRIKKFAALALALAMCFALAISASAANSYTITVNGAVVGRTYTAYKIFDATGSGESMAYTISSSSDWYDTVNGYAGLTLTPSANDATVLVVTKNDDFNAATFAEILDAAKSGKPIAAQETTKENENTVVLDVTTYGEGYYYVDSNLGSLCILDSTSSNVDVNEKNSIPTITKKVQEDSTGAYSETATADVTDTINYQLTVDTGSNANGTGTGVDADYVITDVLPTGFTADDSSVTVKEGETTWTADSDYSVALEDQTLTITLLSTGKLATVGQNASIIITYTATMDTSVVVGGNGNTNTVTLTYNGQESKDDATVYTYEIGGNGTLIKTDGTTDEETDKPNTLAGVKFVLSKTVTKKDAEGKDVEVVKYATFDKDGYLTGWAASKDANGTTIVSDDNGAINVKGLDADTYILTETETLAGYNILQDTITVVIAEDGTVTYKLTNGTADAASSLEIVNQAGSTLPSTGGIGTTIFYVVGGILVLGAGIVLVTKKRMANR